MSKLSSSELDRIADVISQGPTEGYPPNSQRLFLGAAGLLISGSEIVIPDGPWHITNHSNRAGKDPMLLDQEVPSDSYPLVSEELTERWHRDGLITDQYGRPIHPDARQLLADRRIGLPTGLGFFFKYGANSTIDAVVPRRRSDNPPELLLIKRKIGGRWALPGGFLDRSDSSPEVGSRREAAEETNLTDIGGTGEVIMHKRSVGLRDTLHAWTENTVVLLSGDQDYLFETEPKAGDDADDAGWFSEKQITKLDIFDAHQLYIDLALELISQR